MNHTARPAARAASLVAALLLAVAFPALTATLLSASQPPARLSLAARDAAAGTDRFIVGFKAGKITPAQRQQLLDRVGADHRVGLDDVRTLVTGGELLRASRTLDANAAKQLLVALARDPRVEYVEVDRVHRAQLRVDDEHFAEQPHLWNRAGGINVAPAWRRGTGEGVVVAVLDTGITPHEDLAANLVAGRDFISDAERGNDGDGRDGDPTDPGDYALANACGYGHPATASSWHGTAVAGVIAAAAGNRIGVAGVAPGAKVMPVRVLGMCGGWTSDIAEAIVWSAGGKVAGVPANPHPAEVINLSLATAGGCGSTLQHAIDAANAAGAVVVAAAGNDDVDVADRAPANCRGVIAVGASGIDGKPDPRSSHGKAIDVLAPGNGVLTTSNGGKARAGLQAYATRGGTSMSAAMVSGAAALLQSQRPMSPAWVERFLRGGARPTAAPGCATDCAAPRLDVGAAATFTYSPAIAIDGPAGEIYEGNSGTKTVNFTVSLSEPLTTPVTYDLATVAGTATAPGDYTALSMPAQTLAPGATSTAYSLAINGDLNVEDNEVFSVDLGRVQGATVMDGSAGVVIRDDEPGVLRGTDQLNVPNQPTPGYQMLMAFVPEGATNIRFTTLGGSGDADLYVRKGAAPTSTQYDCASTAVGNVEECTFASGGGTYYVMVSTLSSYAYMAADARWTWQAPNKIAISDAYVTEGSMGDWVLNFRVQRPVDSGSQITFDLRTVDGTAVAGSDYDALHVVGETIYGGDTKRDYSITIHGDTAVEPHESFKVRIENLVGGTIDDPEADITLATDDSMTLNFGDGADLDFGETDANATYVVHARFLNLPGSLPAPYSFDLRTVDGTAKAGSDYVAIPTTHVTIPANTNSVDIPITIKGDRVYEPDETFSVEMTNAGPGATVYRQLTPIRITDALDLPTMILEDQAATEGSVAGYKSAAFVVRLDRPAPVPVSFKINTKLTYEDTADTLDFRSIANPVTLVIPAGMTSIPFYIAIKGDATVEPNETLRVDVSGATGVTGATGGTRVFTILNDDGPTLSLSNPTVVEGGPLDARELLYTVTLSQALSTPVTYDIGTIPGNNAGDAGFYDYTHTVLNGETIPAGQTSRTFHVPIKGDLDIETNENVYVSLSSTSGATFLGLRGTGTIVNDDTTPPPSLSIGDTSIVEGNSGQKNLTFTASLSAPANSAVGFRVQHDYMQSTASIDSDYLLDESHVYVIPAGQTSFALSLPVLGDTEVEETEYLQVHLVDLRGPVAGDIYGIGYIINDDGARLMINDVAVGEGASGQKTMTFTVSLTQPAPYTVIYTFQTANGDATAGSDYEALSETGQIQPGQLSATHEVTINGDATVEPTEVFFARLRQPNGASIWDGEGVGYILNDDGPTLSIPDASVGEGNSGTKVMNVTVKLSQAAAVPVSFSIFSANGTATAGSDYTALNLTNQVIPAGELVKVIQVPVAGDTAIEQNESFTVTLKDPVGASLYDRQAIATIYNDDGPTLSVNDVAISEGNSGTKVATFTATLSQAAAVPISYTISTSNLTAAAGSDYVAKSVTPTIPAGSLTQNFAVTINGDATVEANETFRVTLGNISSGATLFKFTGTGTITNDD